MDPKFHDENGNFKPGNPGGPGRPPRKKEETVLRSLLKAIPADEVGPMILEAYEIGRRQNSPRSMLAALNLYMQYTLGKPGAMDGANNDSVNMLVTVLQQAQQDSEGEGDTGDS